MKKLGLFFSLCFLILGVSNAQVVTDYELLETYSIDQIEGIAGSIGIPDGLLNFVHPVDYYKVNYTTMHPQGYEVEASGAICVPQGVSCPMALVSYQHGTVSAKLDVPSQGSDEGMIGVLYSSNGYVVVLADYIGLGESPGMHPYVHADSEASACMDLILGAYELQENIEFNLDGQHFLFGYSQGGHSTMALQKLMEEEYSETYPITASAPMSGPYDVSGIQAEFITADEPYSSPGYLPYVVMGYQAAYGDLYDSLDEIFVEPYASDLPDLFDGSNSFGYINSFMPSVPNQMLQPDLLEDFTNDPEHFLRLKLEDNDLYNWVPQVPTRLYYCTADEQVHFENALFCVEQMTDLGATTVEALNGGNLSHGECAPLAMLGGFFFFEEFYTPYFNPDVEFIVENASNGQATGSVTLDTDEETSDWDIIWSNGSTGTFVDGLESGTYSVNILNSQGCVASYEVLVDDESGIEESEIEWSVIFNHKTQNLELQLPAGDFNLTLYDVNGRSHASMELKQGMHYFPVSGLAPNVYLMQLMSDQAHEVKRVVIRP